jgi:hypothetical protein
MKRLPVQRILGIIQQKHIGLLARILHGVRETDILTLKYLRLYGKRPSRWLSQLQKQAVMGIPLPGDSRFPLVYFIGNFFTDNLSLLYFENNPLMINDTTVIYTLLFIIFGILYKVAVDVSEENNLTI